MTTTTGHRILVVDDSATVRRVIKRTLEDAGYSVSEAPDGTKGLDLANELVPDLVLLDFSLPAMNGTEFCVSLRAVSNLSETPVVLMSERPDWLGDESLETSGAIDAITKPFSPEALLAVTGHALSRFAHESGQRNLVMPALGEQAPTPVDASDEVEASRRVAEGIADALAPSLGGIFHNEISSAVLDRFTPRELFAWLERLVSLVPGKPRGEVAFEGRMEHVGLGEVLQMLQQQQQTGVLRIDLDHPHGTRSMSVSLKDGTVQLAVGSEIDERQFRLGRYLLREELIEREDLDRIIAKQNAAPTGLLGTQLVKLGYISGEDLRRVLVLQTCELLYEALRWRRGAYRFIRFASLPQANEARLGLSLASILMEGLRRVDEWRLIEEQIRSFDQVPRPDMEALRNFDRDELSATERRVLDSVDGERTVRQIVETARMGSFDVCKILFALLTSRLLRIEEKAKAS